MPWDKHEHNAVVEALAVVCELTGTALSEPARKVVLTQLGAYQPAAVIAALNRCAQECKGRLTLADIVQRLDDGRPGPEAAWALMPKDEATGAMVTQEMAAAWGVASSVYEAGDHIGARMAFLEAYRRETAQAKAEHKAPSWFLSAGTSKASNEAAAVDGYKRGLLSRRQAEQYALPEHIDGAAKALPQGDAQKLLTEAAQNPAALAAGAAVRPDKARILTAARLAPKCPEPECAGCKAAAKFVASLEERVQAPRNPRHHAEVERDQT